MKKVESHRKFIGNSARPYQAKIPTRKILMGDRLIADGKYCGNKLDAVPTNVLQEIVKKTDFNKHDRERIRKYLNS